MQPDSRSNVDDDGTTTTASLENDILNVTAPVETEAESEDELDNDEIE